MQLFDFERVYEVECKCVKCSKRAFSQHSPKTNALLESQALALRELLRVFAILARFVQVVMSRTSREGTHK